MILCIIDPIRDRDDIYSSLHEQPFVGYYPTLARMLRIEDAYFKYRSPLYELIPSL